MRDQIRRDGWVEAEVSGDSMSPTLKAGDIVRLEPWVQPRRGDVLAFERGGGLLVHRVVACTRDGLVCRGDNRVVNDGPTRPDEVIGRAVSVRPRGGGPGRPLASGFRGQAAASLTYWVRRTRALWGRLRGEGRLLVRQACGDVPSWRREDLGARWHGCEGVPGATADAAAGEAAEPHVLGTDEIGGTTAEPVALTSARRLVIAADTYCCLPPDARRALLRRRLADAAPAGHTVVIAFARTPRARLVRATGLARRILSGAGHRAGDPGDAMVALGPRGGLSYARFFTSEELAAELKAAGAEVVGLRPRRVRGVDLWQAEVRSRSGTR